MSAAASASDVIGWNCIPVETPERSAMGVEFDHRVDETARVGDERDRPVAEAVELREAAGFEAGGDEDGVAARVHAVREAFVVADADGDERVRGGGGGEGAFKLGVAGAEEGELAAAVDEGGERFEEEVEALLVR